MHETCPLCESRLAPFATVSTGPKRRRRPLAFLDCPTCRLVVRDPAAWPERDAEQAHYRLHENDVDDPGYRRFLAPAFEQVRAGLTPGACLLDFGCGPDSAIAAQVREHGGSMACWDPLFHPDETVLRDGDYDLVSCTETVEHLHRPMATFTRLERLLRPGGRLVIQTGFVPADRPFADWHYWRDPTHVILFRAETFRWLAAARGWRVVELAAPVAVFEISEKEETA